MNGWVNNREAGDLRRYGAHYDVSVMLLGLILVGNAVFLYFTLYYILAINAWILGVLNASVAIVVLSIIIAPSTLLENEVSKISIIHT